MIRLFLRLGFWGALIVAILPSARNQGVYNGEIGPVMLANAVSATVNDFSNFCGRNSSACQTGKLFLGQMAKRAENSVNTALARLNDPVDQPDRQTMTGSIKK